jgi:hypothetical protein
VKGTADLEEQREEPGRILRRPPGPEGGEILLEVAGESRVGADGGGRASGLDDEAGELGEVPAVEDIEDDVLVERRLVRPRKRPSSSRLRSASASACARASSAARFGLSSTSAVPADHTDPAATKSPPRITRSGLTRAIVPSRREACGLPMGAGMPRPADPGRVPSARAAGDPADAALANRVDAMREASLDFTAPVGEWIEFLAELLAAELLAESGRGRHTS